MRSVFSLAMLYLRASAHLEHFGRVADRHVLVICGDAPLTVHDLGSPGSTWSWSVADWQANQETAIEEIATHLDNMFASMVAVPSEQAQQIQQAAAALPASSGTNIR